MRFEQRRLYGFLLSCTNIITLIYWKVFDFDFGLLFRLQTDTANPWSFVPASYPFLVQEFAPVLVWGYIIASLATPLLFLLSRIPWAVCLGFLGAALIFKLGIFYSSYDLMGNYHYMCNLMIAGFLLTNGNLFFLQIMLAFFYFGAGLIKLNWEWISGSALLVETFIRGPLLIAACIYVIVLELVLIWGLFFKNEKIRTFTFFQLFAFHIFSWHIVGYYYPCIMITLLTVFLVHKPNPHVEINPLVRGRAPAWIYVYVIVFLVAQFYPKILNKNEAVTAEGRLFSLNMLDAKVDCLASYEVRTEQGLMYLDQPLAYAVRVRCDPYVYFNYGKSLCNSLEKAGQRPVVLLNIQAKKASDLKETWTVRNQDVCDPDLHYSVFKNDWVYDDPQTIPNDPPIDVSEKAAYMWRENSARTGESTQSVKLNLNLKVKSLNLQSGIHRAAKSSPVGQGTDWVLGSDNGWLWGFNGSEKSWGSYFPKADYGFHASAAISSKNNIFIGSYDGVFHKINAENGQRLWARKLSSAIGSSALMVDSQVFVSAEKLPESSLFYSLKADTGEVNWMTGPYPGLAHSSMSFDSVNDIVTVGTNAGLLIGFDRATGKEIFKTEIPGKIIATPLIAEGVAYAISTEGHLLAYNITTQKTLWTYKADSGSRASPSYVSDRKIIIFPLENGRLIALEAKTGKMLWEYFEPHLHVSSGVVTQGSFYWDQCAEKTLCVLDAHTGTVLKTFSLPANFSSTPLALRNNALLVSLDDGSMAELSE